MAKREYVIVRTRSAGAFAGTLVSRDGGETVLSDARRLWYWAGAASLSELAVRGTNNARECKFPVAVARVVLLETIEVLSVSGDAEASIKSVPEWKA